jgi:anti-sigma factor RsiW
MKPTISDFDLLAYADGELPEDRREAFECALADQPQLAARLDELLALRRCARRTMRDAVPQAPQRLRQAIADLQCEPAPTRNADQSSTPLRTASNPWRWRLTASAIAAALLASAVGWLYLSSINTGPIALPPPPPATYTFAEFVTAVTNKHLACSTLEDHFIDPRFPRSIKDVGPAARKFMAQPVLTPDMSSIGYAFAGAGPCHVPGGQTLHLLYRSTDTGDFVSLFVQQQPWLIDLEDGRQAIGAGPDADHPMLIWRADDVMYYLVCDDFGACEKAQQLIDQQLKGRTPMSSRLRLRILSPYGYRPTAFNRFT